MFNEIIEKVLEKEGLFSDNKHDKGGKTKYGITENIARNYGYKGDMQKLPLETAKDIYKRMYWKKEFEQFDQTIAEFLFDCHVNHGYKGMSLILQRAINLNTRNNVVVDGYAGKNTYSAATKIDPKRLYVALNAQRCSYYISICNNDETQETFIYGWLKNRIDWKKVGEYIG